MQIEAGKYYRTRDGRKVGPMRYEGGMSEKWPWTSGVHTYSPNGVWACDFRETEEDLIAEWTDEPEDPTIWYNMTPEEKGALLLAHHEGKVIEGYVFDAWHEADWSDGPSPAQSVAYRIRPEPKRETVTLYSGWPKGGSWAQWRDDDATHRITFDTIDGEPDVASIKMEKL